METKFKINQVVYFLHENRIRYGKIKNILITENDIKYSFKGGSAFLECNLFSKREEVYKFF